jgi:pimeloyl-ACP methyl ester carboxylesterase
MANAICTSADGSCTEWISVTNSHALQIHRTYPLDAVQSGVTRAVVVIHGTDSNADEYFSRMIGAAGVEGVVDETLVIAPLFRGSSDGAASNELHWSDSNSYLNNWRQGDQSANADVSSFTVLDSLLQRVADRSLFPNLRVITIAGHSAGAQFVQRYAAGTQAPNQFPDHAFTYVVANPSSYLYLDRRRPEAGSTTEFTEPSTTCTFNRYKYGLDNLNTYMSSVGATKITEQYPNRSVIYLAGELDNNPDDPDLSTSCRAMLQGPERFSRASAYANYIDNFYPTHFHQFTPVSGVGHSSTLMFRSPEGRGVIFADEAEIPRLSLAPPSPPKNLRTP